MRVLLVRLAFAALVAGGVITCSLNAQQPAAPQVTAQDLRDGLKDPTRWLTYSRRLRQPAPQPAHADHAGERAPPDARSGPSRPSTLGKFEATPLVRRRRHLRHRPARHRRGRSTRAPAARSGATAASCPSGLIACCGLRQPRLRRARRPAVQDDARRARRRDRHEDRRDRSGTPRWRTTGTATAATTAPLVVKDKVIVGMAGAEYGVRGFIDAYDAQTGKRAWRFYTTAGPGRSGPQHVARHATRRPGRTAADRPG